MSALPGGVVTFLFTDIEGSTRRWDQHPDLMMQAIGRHNALLKSAIEGQGGFTFKMVGDEFCAVFSDSPSACRAAIAAQRALQAEDWGEIGPILVRMALHTGAAEERDGDYFGPTVNRVARLLSAGHGGQILVTRVALDMARDHLPVEITARDFGERRLKDLSRPERIFELAAPGLPSDFPPLRTLDVVPNNLPYQPTPFIGRDELVKSCANTLRQASGRALTLTGPGGAGKTRIALQVAAEMVDEFEDGIFLVSLSPLRDPDMVAPAIARTLGVHEALGRGTADALAAYLREKHTLLVLDNFEQVSTAAGLVSRLLAQCAGLRVLVTSRAALRIHGERLLQVPPMSVPEEAEDLPVEAALGFEAVELFVGRAQAVRPDFVFTPETAPLVVDICRRLDGLPLALELAAARINVLPLRAILSRLDDSLGLLTSGPRDVPSRQRTLRSTIQWSYDLLAKEEQLLLRRVAVFAGGFTLAAAESVCWGSAAEPRGRLASGAGGDVLDLLTSLFDQSLLRSEESLGEPRFMMLSTIREYLLERLTEGQELREMRHAHAAYFLEMAESADPLLRSGFRRSWLEQLQVEHDNLLSALEWCVSEPSEQHNAVRLAGSLHWFWYFRGYLTEGREWLRRALATEAGRSANEAVALALDAAGRLAMLQNDERAAGEHLVRAVALWRELGDGVGLAYSLCNLGTARIFWNESPDGLEMLKEGVSLFRGLGEPWGLAYALDLLAGGHVLLVNMEEAVGCYEESLASFRRLADSWGIGAELGELARLDIRQGKYMDARTKLRESLIFVRAVEDRWATAHCLRSLGDVAFCLGETAEARASYEEAAEDYRKLGDEMRMAACVRSLGHVARTKGDIESARALYAHSLGVAAELDALPTLAWTVLAIARLRGIQGDAELAARLFGASDSLARASASFLPPVDEAGHEADRCAVRAALGEERFAGLYGEGQKLELRSAIDAARQAVSLPCGADGEPGAPHLAGERSPATETKVLRLAAAGMTDVQIARDLDLGVQAVRAYLYLAGERLGVRSRGEAVAHARGRGLLGSAPF